MDWRVIKVVTMTVRTPRAPVISNYPFTRSVHRKLVWMVDDGAVSASAAAVASSDHNFYFSAPWKINMYHLFFISNGVKCCAIFLFYNLFMIDFGPKALYLFGECTKYNDKPTDAGIREGGCDQAKYSFLHCSNAQTRCGDSAAHTHTHTAKGKRLRIARRLSSLLFLRRLCLFWKVPAATLPPSSITKAYARVCEYIWYYLSFVCHQTTFSLRIRWLMKI